MYIFHIPDFDFFPSNSFFNINQVSALIAPEKWPFWKELAIS